MPRRRLLASCLAAALAFPCLAGAAPSLAPPLAMMPVQDQVMAPVVARFRADLASFERVHDTTAGPRREAALRRLYGDWQQRLAQIDPAALPAEDRLDHALFRRDLQDLLLAELEVRFHPIDALLAALRSSPVSGTP